MGVFQSTSLVCNSNPHCSEWVRIYLKYCLCSIKDGICLTLGLISVLSWGFAEVPQIVNNYREKSTEGLSIAFLAAWILGDIFNLFGCILEPATLPTQYYMAVLYMISSLVLFVQTVYYGHIYHHRKISRQDYQVVSVAINNEGGNDSGKKVINHANDSLAIGVPHSYPIPVLRARESYYKSARFLSRSYTLPGGSSAETSMGSLDVEEPLLGGDFVAAQSAPPAKTKAMLCVVSVATFFLTGSNLRLLASNRFDAARENQNLGVVIGARRMLLKASGMNPTENGGEGSSGIGTLLGWAMAAIYMGGRLPQICLNIRRGNVKGLSLGMFICALVGNITYIASILVNSLDWSKIQPNLPWLVDAGGCALLDTCILIQFMYYFRIHRDQ